MHAAWHRADARTGRSPCKMPQGAISGLWTRGWDGWTYTSGGFMPEALIVPHHSAGWFGAGRDVLGRHYGSANKR